MKLPLKQIGEEYAMCLMNQYDSSNMTIVNSINSWLGRVPNKIDRYKAEAFFHYWRALHSYPNQMRRLNYTQRHRISLYAQDTARKMRDDVFYNTTYQDWGFCDQSLQTNS